MYSNRRCLGSRFHAAVEDPPHSGGDIIGAGDDAVVVRDRVILIEEAATDTAVPLTC